MRWYHLLAENSYIIIHVNVTTDRRSNLTEMNRKAVHRLLAEPESTARHTRRVTTAVRRAEATWRHTRADAGGALDDAAEEWRVITAQAKVATLDREVAAPQAHTVVAAQHLDGRQYLQRDATRAVARRLANAINA